MATAVSEVERMLGRVRVPSGSLFEQNASDYLDADDLTALAADLVGQYPELGIVSEFRVRYAWKREGGADNEAGKCKKLGAEVKHLTALDFFIWLAADRCREMSQRQIEALLYHELCHIGANEKGKAQIEKHDVELFYAEVRHYGAWHDGLEAARETFAQLALPL